MAGGGHHSMGRLHNLGLIHALGGTAGLMLLPAAAAMELSRNRKNNRSFTYGRRRESEGATGEHCIGQLLVSLRYSPADNQLCVGIVRASGIRSAAPYVTVWMIRDGQKTQKRSTPKLTGADSRRYSIAPVFDEAFPFDVSSIELQNSTLIISVMNSGTGGDSDTEIGYCVLGELGVDETSREHWREAVGRPGQIITQWHGLMADW